jgi:hypothetical protein
MSIDDNGFEYRQKQFKQRTEISKLAFKLPISLVLQDENKSKQFYGHVFEKDLHMSSLCNTKFVGSSYDGYIRTHLKANVKKKSESKRKTLTSYNIGGKQF